MALLRASIPSTASAAKFYTSSIQFILFERRRRIISSLSSSQHDTGSILKEESDEFLRWLREKAGTKISSVLSIGNSIHGRSLFASRSIEAGECILEVPYSAQLTLDKTSLDIKQFIGHDIGSISQLAIVLLSEKKMGQDSKWGIYINKLPTLDQMHNTIFWSEEELDMIQRSPLYQETISHKCHIEKEFSALKPVLEQFSQDLSKVHLEDFMHAYALVSSRAWETSKRGVSLIPFADFLNHDGTSDSILLSDLTKGVSEVIADRGYTIGEQVMIRYGKFSNATLLLDFGFTLPYNRHDQVQIWMDIPQHDPLNTMKLELIQKHCLPKTGNSTSLKNPGINFTIKEVKSGSIKGKGIPLTLRAFARVLSTKSPQELESLVVEAAENDGRLARRPFKNIEREIKAHCILSSRFTQMIQDHEAAIKVLEYQHSTDMDYRLSIRSRMARDLLHGELRILRSASSWLTSYCGSLYGFSENLLCTETIST